MKKKRKEEEEEGEEEKENVSYDKTVDVAATLHAQPA